jgi:lysozyme family protein
MITHTRTPIPQIALIAAVLFLCTFSSVHASEVTGTLSSNGQDPQMAATTTTRNPATPSTSARVTAVTAGSKAASTSSLKAPVRTAVLSTSSPVSAASVSSSTPDLSGTVTGGVSANVAAAAAADPSIGNPWLWLLLALVVALVGFIYYVYSNRRRV